MEFGRLIEQVKCLGVRNINASALPFVQWLAIIAGVEPLTAWNIMRIDYSIRELHSMQDLLETVELQKDVWGMLDHECTSPHTMKAATVAGGSVLAAEVGGRKIGFCFGIAAKRDEEIWLWSHMTAVHPEFQSHGIGFALKQAQREWSLANGYRVMAWTFDPMQAGNANFNMNRLGAVARRYYVNHYGAMQDDLNAGLASDRLEAQWRLDDPRVLELARRGSNRCFTSDIVRLVCADEDGTLRHIQRASFDAGHYGIEIPLNIANMKQSDIERAKIWQLHLREAITSLLAAGYQVSDFVRGESTGCYVMSRDDQENA